MQTFLPLYASGRAALNRCRKLLAKISTLQEEDESSHVLPIFQDGDEEEESSHV